MGNDADLEAPRLARRTLGRTGLELSTIGFGAFKIGRNTGIKYAHGYDLPSDEESDRLLRAVVDDLGINYIDTAPAYGLSEERVGRVLGARKEVVISTKVGETFENGVSIYDFSEAAVRASIARSRKRLRRETLDLVFVHSNGEDERIQESTDVITTLQDLKKRGDVRWIGFSGKTIAGELQAIDVSQGTDWADVLMVEFNRVDHSHECAINEARALRVGVIAKKPLASGILLPHQAIEFILKRGVDHMVIGGLNINHLRESVDVARSHWTNL